MRTDTAPADPPKTIRLADYRPPDYWIDNISLDFSLDPARTIVKSRLDVRRSVSAHRNAPLALEGEALELLSISMNGAPLPDSAYEVGEKSLRVDAPPEAFVLEIENAIAPEANTALSGLYMSKGMFCTQCEAEGFRRITYYPDRPDVLAKFRVRIEADKAAYPILLANGNNVAAGDLAGGRHFAEWADPHPKPAYLFALVGGDLACAEDAFVTRSGREVALKVFVQPQNLDKCGYTLDALKRAMRWDEERFGREYDLDVFMIVAVDHFNFGAMENKGLNIFNSAYVLASPATATDADYEAIESIVGHEYFHNWSGNRVTLRDWFQLCLKEGFTVFRDQEFSADMRSRPVQRIKDVRRLRSRQFPEDAGPLAHPPRPAEYISIDNFYTATVYEKGAELSRMLMTLLGREKFRAATDLYFSRHDGEAATVEDFVAAMEDAGGIDLTQFRLWYTEAGAPRIDADVKKDVNGSVSISLRQSLGDADGSAGADERAPRHIPVAYALIGDESGAVLEEGLLEFRTNAQAYPLGRYEEPVIASLFREFSAPVTLEIEHSLEDRLALLRNESDLFSRWNAGEGLWKDLCLAFADAKAMDDRGAALAAFADALGASLAADDLDPALVAEILKAPSAAEIAQLADPIDPAAIVAGRETVRAAVARRLESDLELIAVRRDGDAPFTPDAAAAGDRALRNAAMALLVAAGRYDVAEAQARRAENMTDEAAALGALAPSAAPSRDDLLAAFYERWRDDPLVVNKWLAFRAMETDRDRNGADGADGGGDGDALAAIAALTRHERFDLKTPNKVRALLGVFSHQNIGVFHRSDGAGYDLLVENIFAIDKLNPQLAAQLTTALETWRRLEPKRRDLAGAALEKLLKESPSPNLFEMATRLLEG